MTVFRPVPSVVPILAAFLLPVACGDSTGPDGVPVAGEPVSATIGPEGGSISVGTRDGVVVDLAFPPGAVLAPTEVVLRPGVPPEGDWFAVAIEPIGLVLHEDVVATATLPAGTAHSDAQLYLGPTAADGILLPTTSSGQELETSLRLFGIPETETLTLALGVVDGLSTLAWRGRLTSPNNFGGGPVACGAMIASQEAAYDGYVALGQFRRAYEAAREIAARLQRNDCPGVEAWLASAQSTACDGLQAALDGAAAANTSSVGEFEAQVSPVVEWAGIVAAAGGECAAEANVPSGIAAEISDFTLFHNSALLAVQPGQWSEYTDRKDDAVSALVLYGRALALGLPDPADQLHKVAFLPAVDRMRAIAYELCRSGGWHYALSRVSSTGFFAARDIVGVSPPRPGRIDPAPDVYASFTDDDVWGDLHACATSFDVSGVASDGAERDRVKLGGGGEPGQATFEGSLEVPMDGKIVLDGRIPGFTCWDGVQADREVVVILEGTEVLTLLRGLNGDYVLGNPGEIDVQQASAAAGISLNEGNTASLTVRRRRSECDGRLWGPEDYVLADLSLTWREAGLFEFRFVSDLEGWETGTTSDGWGTAQWQSFCGKDRPKGCVKLDGVGGDGVANAWIFRTFDLPEGVTTLELETAAHNRNGADSEYRIRAVEGGTEVILVDWTATAGDAADIHWRKLSVDISGFAGKQVTFFLEGGDNGPGSHEQRYYDNVTIR